MKTIAADAGASLLELLDDIANGETIVITRDDQPVAQLVPLDDQRQRTVNQRSGIVEAWEKYRREHNITLGDDLTIRDLIEEGRKY